MQSRSEGDEDQNKEHVIYGSIPDIQNPPKSGKSKPDELEATTLGIVKSSEEAPPHVYASVSDPSALPDLPITDTHESRHNNEPRISEDEDSNKLRGASGSCPPRKGDGGLDESGYLVPNVMLSSPATQAGSTKGGTIVHSSSVKENIRP